MEPDTNSLLQKRKSDEGKIVSQDPTQFEDEGNDSDTSLSNKVASSEIDNLRVCIQGIDKFTDEKALMKFCKSFNPPINLAAIGKKRGKNYAFLAFENIEDKARFEKESVNMKIKNRKVKIKPVFVGSFALKFEKKVKTLEREAERPRQKPEVSEEFIKQEMSIPLQEKVCPLWQTEYPKQIEKKRQEFENVLKDIKSKARKVIIDEDLQKAALPKWLKPENLMEDMCCPLKAFEESEKEWHFFYRNKAEFTIGESYDFPGEVRVGFNKGTFNKGVVFVESADDCPIVTKEAMELAKLLENYMKKSEIAGYGKTTHEGFWRNLVIRQSNKTKEILVTIVGAKKNISEDAYNQMKSEVVKVFTDPDVNFLYKQTGYKIVSIIFVTHDGVSDNIPFDGSYEILYGGQDYYFDEILGYRFRVSFSAFLQVNTSTCEKLYKLIQELSQIDQDTVFLDVCCGIGTIGICAAAKAKKIIGIEMIQKAIDDANFNAKLNNLENVEYHCAKVESVIADVIKPYAGKNKIVAVVDPPRAGLHKDVVTALRRCKGLDHLVYVSCNPEMVVGNLLDLCLPESKKRKAPPFTITEAYAVDLFPQTMHYEGVYNLKRLYDTC